MKLAALNALIAAVEDGSLRAAARRVGVSQPALTKMLRELERELSTTLLVRSTTGVVPTAQGRALYETVLRLARARHPVVEAGIFGADMQVALVNDGPVTIPLRIA